MSRTGKDEFIARALVDLVVRPTQTAEEMRTRIHKKWVKIRACSALLDEIDTLSVDTSRLKAVILDRLTYSTISVRWSDSQSGVYGEQTWRMGRASRSSYCAATGLPIQHGDVVFKPKTVHYKMPFNGSWMILASVVESIDDRVGHGGSDVATFE